MCAHSLITSVEEALTEVTRARAILFVQCAGHNYSGEDRRAMVMQDSTSRWSSGVCERVEGGRAALQCVLLIGAAWEPTCRLQTTLLLTSLMHHAVWILTINRIVLCICLWILWPIYSVSYSVARGCSMLNQILMTFMYMQLFHVLHMHLLRLTPQCHEFF